MLVPWPADDLVSGQRLTWQVRVWGDGTPTELVGPGCSRPACSTVGLVRVLDRARRERGARGAGTSPRPGPAPRVRARPSVERARLHATAHGVYEAFLGEERIGDLELTRARPATGIGSRSRPTTSPHSCAKGPTSCRWCCRTAGGGGRPGTCATHDCYGTTLAFLGQLHVDHPDGTRTVVATDGTWTWTTGPIRGADLMAGQTVDLRIALEGWAPVTVVDHGLANLCGSPAPPMRRIEELRPVAVTEPVPGHQVVDVGQNINGWVRLTGLGAAGTEVTLTHGEVLDDRGDVTIEHLLSADQATGEPPERHPGRPGSDRGPTRRGVRAPPHQSRLPVRAGRGPRPRAGRRRHHRSGGPHGPASDGLVPVQ